MVLCIIALVVFSILGLFSARYRILAKEAFDCVFRKMTLRKCRTNLDGRIKSHVTGKLMKRTPKIANIVYKRFELISWFFVIIFFTSMIFSGITIYNVVAYGNCNGPHSNEVCLLTGTADLGCGSEHCETDGCDCGGPGANCTADNNFYACDGNCECRSDVCG